MSGKRKNIIIDEAIFAKIAQGDKEALTSLYIDSYRPVFALLLSCTHNYHDAEDLLQETYIKICQAAHLYKPGGNPMAWIMKIARNLCISRYRSESKMYLTSLENDIVEIPYEYISSLEDSILIEKLFKELKKEESEIILLHLLKGFTFKEISEIMDKPLGSVLSQYYRGMKKLKKGSGI